MIFYCFWRAAVGGTMVLILGTAPFSLLAGQPVPPPKRPNDDLKPAQSVAARNFRARTDRALNAAFPTTFEKRKAQAEELLALYREIGEAKEVIPVERSRLQTRLKSRLGRLANAIALDAKQARSAIQAQTERSRSANQTSAGTHTSPPSQPAAAGSNGGAAQDDGQALVELIQATIAPQSWDVNGGPGSIVYWPAWHVLVVRQTDDVHEQIGGVVHGMRK